MSSALVFSEFNWNCDMATNLIQLPNRPIKSSRHHVVLGPKTGWTNAALLIGTQEGCRWMYKRHRLIRVQKKAAKFAHHTNSPKWETLASCRKLSHIYALFKAYSGERSWKAIGDRLQQPHYLSRVDHKRKIRIRRQRADVGKYSFVNRTIQLWNRLPADVLETLPCKQITFKKMARKAIIEVS
jgi:hypothetical protein